MVCSAPGIWSQTGKASCRYVDDFFIALSAYFVCVFHHAILLLHSNSYYLCNLMLIDLLLMATGKVEAIVFHNNPPLRNSWREYIKDGQASHCCHCHTLQMAKSSGQRLPHKQLSEHHSTTQRRPGTLGLLLVIHVSIVTPLGSWMLKTHVGSTFSLVWRLIAFLRQILAMTLNISVWSWVKMLPRQLKLLGFSRQKNSKLVSWLNWCVKFCTLKKTFLLSAFLFV